MLDLKSSLGDKVSQILNKILKSLVLFALCQNWFEQKLTRHLINVQLSISLIFFLCYGIFHIMQYTNKVIPSTDYHTQGDEQYFSHRYTMFFEIGLYFFPFFRFISVEYYAKL